MAGAPRFLVYGYGNPGRLDDGLGPAAVERIRAWKLPGIALEANYQLSLEDCELLTHCDVVLFIDASVQDRPPFYLERVPPCPRVHFSSHSLDPAAVVGFAADLFDASPDAYLLAIPGYVFNEFGEGLSPRAVSGLEAALDFLRPILEARDPTRLAAQASVPARPEPQASPFSLEPQHSK